MSEEPKKPKAKAKPKELDMYQKLVSIQSALVAPKGQKNTFGKYSYRSCEDILEATKPLLAQNGIALIMDDEIQMIGDRFYVKATAAIISGDYKTISVSASAREAEIKKGMDSAQITGATSSYARKYALNGLFAIDDCKDSDTNEYRANTAQTREDRPQSTNAKQVRQSPAKDEYIGGGSDEYADGSMLDAAKNTIKKLCIKHKVGKGIGTAWIAGQYEGKSIDDMKDDPSLLLDLMMRFEQEFIVNYVKQNG